VYVSTTSASTTFREVASNSKDTTTITFDLSINKDAFLSRNIEAVFPVKLSASTLSDNTLGGASAQPTEAEWNLFLGNMAKTSIAPGGILNIVDTINIEMGGKTLSISNPDMHARLMMACTDPEHMDKSLSTCNFIPDLVSNYLDAETTENITAPSIDDGKDVILRNNAAGRLSSFSGMERYTYGNRMPAYRLSTVDNSKRDFHISFDLHTIIPSSLFNTRDITKPNIPGLDKISVTFNFNSNYNRLFSFVQTNDVTTMTNAFKVNKMEFTSNPKLLTVLYTAPTVISSEMKDQKGNIKSYMIDYTALDVIGRFPIDTLAANTNKVKQNYSNSTMNCAQLPKRLYIFLAPESQAKYLITDTSASPGAGTPIANLDDAVSRSCVPRSFARIDSCVLTVGNSQSLVSAKARDLYRMSVENGLKYDYDIAMYTGGYPLIVDLRKDCSLPDSLIGNTGATNIGIDLTYTHLDSRTDRKYQAWVFAEYDQILRYQDGVIDFKHSLVKANLASLTGKDLVKSVPHNLYDGHPETYGGGVLDTVKSKVKSGINFVVKNKDHIKDAAKAVSKFDMY
jgi:hypothetical protein